MGMSAHYYAYAQDVIEAIKNGGDGEALDEYDLDKMWDAMHKTLTGKNVFEAMSAGEIFTTPNPLSWAIFGRDTAGGQGRERGGILRGCGRRKSRSQSDAEHRHRRAFSKRKFYGLRRGGHLPRDMGYESEFEDIKAELKEHFNGLFGFYQNAADKGLGTLIVIV